MSKSTSKRVRCAPPGCLYRELDSAIMVTKFAEDRHRCDATPVLDGAMDRSIFAKRPMSHQLVIIGGILRQMVDALASDRSDQPFGEAVLAKASPGRWACHECPWHEAGV